MKKIFILIAVLFMAQGAQAEESSVVDKASESVKKGGKVVAKGVKTGGDATVKGLKKAGEWVGKKLQVGGEKLEEVSK